MKNIFHFRLLYYMQTVQSNFINHITQSVNALTILDCALIPIFVFTFKHINYPKLIQAQSVNAVTIYTRLCLDAFSQCILRYNTSSHLCNTIAKMRRKSFFLHWMLLLNILIHNNIAKMWREKQERVYSCTKYQCSLLNILIHNNIAKKTTSGCKLYLNGWHVGEARVHIRPFWVKTINNHPFSSSRPWHIMLIVDSYKKPDRTIRPLTIRPN